MALTRALLTTGLLALCTLNAFIVLSYHSNSIRTSAPDQFSWIGHDFPEKLPLPRDPETVLMTVEESWHFPLGEPGNDAWRHLLTISGGYCHLGPRSRLFAVTMFHELHCLRIFNSGFGAGTELDHIIHCLSYLRHGALCSADLTLESGDFVKRNFTRDRMGATHQCRDWSQVYEALAEYWHSWKLAEKVLFPGDAD